MGCLTLFYTFLTFIIVVVWWSEKCLAQLEYCHQCNAYSKDESFCKCLQEPCLQKRKGCVENCGVCLPDVTKKGRTFPDCYDHLKTCIDYKNEGLCKWKDVRILCKRSCGGCDECINHNPLCKEWKDDGWCEKAVDYMRTECKESCGICDCYDHSIWCKVWQKNSQCKYNAPIMNIRCPLSCGVCGPTDEKVILISHTTESDEHLFETDTPITYTEIFTTTTTNKPSTTTQSTTTEKPSTTTQSTSTEKPSTTTQSTTTEKPSTTTQSTTTEKPSTTTQSTSTEKPSTTTQSTTTEKLLTTTQSTSTEKPSTTTQSTSTEKPSTTTQSTTTQQPSTTTQSTTTEKPTTTTQSSTTSTTSTTKATSTTIKATSTTTSTTTKTTSTTTDFYFSEEFSTTTEEPIRTHKINEVCGNVAPRRVKRIVNGEELQPPSSWPWIVGITHSSAPNRTDCGGALLTEEFVLTAAHCFTRPGGMDPKKYTLRFGEHNLEVFEGPEYFGKIDRIYIHQLYNIRDYDYDIAVLRLVEPVKLTDQIRPSCVAEEDTVVKPGKSCFVAGWGYVGEGQPSPDPILKVAMVPIVKHKECSTKYSLSLEKVTDRMLCASGDGKTDSCEGDSGGPLVCKREDGIFIQVGIVSWGIGCGRKDLFGVYTDVAKQRNWLNTIVEREKRF